MQNKLITQEEANRIFFRILEMQLPGSREQIWATLQSEHYNEERTIDRLLNQQFAQPTITRPDTAS